MNNISPRFPGWLAKGLGIGILVAVVCYGLSFRVYNRVPFLLVSTLATLIAGLLNLILVWLIYRHWGAQPGRLDQLILATGTLGSLVTLIGSGFDLLNVSVGYNPFILFPLSQTGSIITVGYAILGIWLLALNIQAGFRDRWPPRLVWLGIAVGTMMAVGLLAIPRVFIPYVSLYHQPVPELGEWIGSLAWRFLYPAWAIWLGSASHAGQPKHPAYQSPRPI